MAKNRIKVNIAGMTYTLVTDEGEERLKKIASYVDREIERASDPKFTKNMEVILASINIADELFKLREDYDKLQEEAEEPLRLYPKLKEDQEDLQKSYDELSSNYKTSKEDFLKSVQKIEGLNKEIDKLKVDLDRKEKDLKKRDEDLKKQRETMTRLQKELVDRKGELDSLKEELK